MKKLSVSLIIVALIVMVIGPSTALAGAYNTQYMTVITYQNLGSAATTTLTLGLYDSPTDITPLQVTRPNLNSGASTAIAISSLVSGSFLGTAIMSSDQPLAAVLVQVPQNTTTVFVRPVSTGFTSGTSNSLLASVVKNAFDKNTSIAVQNVGGTDTNIVVKLYNTSASVVYNSGPNLLKPGAGKHFDLGALAGVPNGFSGSAVVEGGGGLIVTTAMEMDIAGVGASTYEGVGTGASTAYLPSAACNYFGKSSFFAAQNTSLTTQTSVTITYQPSGIQETKTALPGAKAVFTTCDKLPSGWLGSASVVSSATPIVAVGKLTGAGASSAFVGFTSGTSKISLPYVRWASLAHYQNRTMQRAFIAIQNVGPLIPAGSVITVNYVDRDGNTVGTHTITVPAGGMATGAKVSSNFNNVVAGPDAEFGCYNSCTQFGGGATIQGPAGSQLAVIGRIQTYISSSSEAVEDYNGLPMP